MFWETISILYIVIIYYCSLKRFQIGWGYPAVLLFTCAVVYFFCCFLLLVVFDASTMVASTYCLLQDEMNETKAPWARFDERCGFHGVVAGGVVWCQGMLYKMLLFGL